MIETAVKERPILFSGSMVRVILEGRKTVTRRVMKQQPVLHKLIPKSDTGWQSEAWGYRLKNGTYQDVECDGLGRVLAECPYGAVGDRLWVRETWRPRSWGEDFDWMFVEYKAGGSPQQIDPFDTWGEFRAECFWEQISNEALKNGATQNGEMLNNVVLGWKPSIHMPRKASRINLEITGVRVERLQDITEEQAIAEGIEPHASVPDAWKCYGHDDDWVSPTPVDSFKSLWQSINSDRPGRNWDSNPWVWAVEFKKI